MPDYSMLVKGFATCKAFSMQNFSQGSDLCIPVRYKEGDEYKFTFLLIEV